MDRFNFMKFILAFVFVCVVPGRVTAEGLSGYPKLKAGDWEMKVENKSMPIPYKMIYCVDEVTQDRMLSQSENSSMCDKPTLKQEGDTYVANFNCTIMGKKSTTRAETTFDGDTHITSHVTVTTEGHALMSMGSEGKFLGPCKDGRKPGDFAMLGPDGKTLQMGNVEQMQKQMNDALSKKGSK